jgi:hypothetical protein
MKKKLNVVTLATKSYIKIINDYFLSTLPKDIENMKILYLNDMDNVRYSSATKFLEKRKLEMLCKEIESNLGNNLFFIDGDVTFAYGVSFKEEINNILEEYDLAFQFNDDWYNFGVFAINCNIKTLKYFKHLLNHEIDKAIENSKIHDQHLANALLGVFHPNAGVKVVTEKQIKDIKHTSLPLKYFGNHFKNCKYPADVPKDVVFIHATNTYTMEEKLNLLWNFKHHYYDLRKGS